MTELVRTDLLGEDRPQSKQFESFVLECLKSGLRVRFQARGASMSPAVCDGEMVYVKPASVASLRRGDIVLVKGDRGFRLHRLTYADADKHLFITRGDCGVEDDPTVGGEQILGVAVA
ncbi:MAG: S24/S26 family peptidase, partial [Candidatus Sulfotelmatobacter sp.]